MLGCDLQGVALPDVASQTYVEPGIPEQIVDQGCGGRLSVASGDAYFLRRVIAPRELNLRNDADSLVRHFADHRNGVRDSRTLDDFVGVEYQVLGMPSLFERYIPFPEFVGIAVLNLPVV